MTLWILPEFNREGSAFCKFSLQVGKHNETPTDKGIRRQEPPWGPKDPPLLGRKEGTLRQPKNINLENLTWLGGRDHNDIPRCHHWTCST